VTLDEVRQLIELVEKSSIAELEIGRGDDKVRIVRQHQPATVIAAPAQAVAPAAPLAAAASPVESVRETASREAEISDLVDVEAPMVGTFYLAPSPEAPPFVKVGDHVDVGQTICIIEAMKLMNEVPSDVPGTVVEIVGQNGQPVEYGQTLIRVKPV
jgi:acetyl-CoA carboxylase biotin carboxyl carrier protein